MKTSSETIVANAVKPRETELIKELQEAALDKCVIAALESTNK